MNLLFKNLLLPVFCLSFPGLVRAQHHGAVLPQSKNKIVVIAHRGNHVDVPENTIASTRAAILAGADYVEVDLRTTKDGHLVVLHDGTVDRTTNGQGKISELTLAEVKKLQVFNQNKKTHRIPEFSEILAACKGQINMYLDFKAADVAKTWEQIKNAGMEHHVIVYANNEAQFKQWKEVAPDVPMMTSLPGSLKTKEAVEVFLESTRVKVLDNISDQSILQAVHAYGVSVWLDVQSPSEGPASWKEALEKGVQGLQTDKPAALVKYLRESGHL